MARKSETKKIGRYQYMVNGLGAVEGQKIILRLMKFYAPALSAAAQAKTKEDQHAKFIGGLADAVDPDTFMELADTMAKQSLVNLGKGFQPLAPIYDAHFAGEYKELVQWFVFAMGVNFGGFFRDIMREGTSMAVPSTTGQAEESESPST